VDDSLAGLRALREAARLARSRGAELQNMPAAAAERSAAGVTLFGHTLPTAIELAITCVFAVVFRTLAVSGFGKPE
jgi:hypothetical protein